MRKEVGKYFIFILLVGLLVLSYKIISPFIVVLISAFVLSYLVKPIFVWLSKRINKKVSAIICIIILLFIILVPVGTVIGGIINQATIIADDPASVGAIQSFINLPLISKLPIDVASVIQRGTDILIDLFSSAISYLPGLILSIIVMVMAIYFFLINWASLTKEIEIYLPKKNKKKTIKDISDTTHRLIYGIFLIALIQFGVSSVGFFILGIDFYLLLPSLIFFLAFIPTLGPALVWVPLFVYYLLTQNWYLAGGVLIIGLILSIVIDSLLAIKIMGDKAKINPLIILLGILGGIVLFGVFGFIIGPLILVYTIKLLQEVIENK